MNINFFFPDKKITLKERIRLKSFIDKLFKKEGFNLGFLTYVFCSDEYLLNLNKEFLQHDYYTDIITFDLSESKKQKDGEIYISIDRVKDNAQNLESSFNNELHRVMFHGALHLCGYKDKAKNDIKEMRTAEDRYLKLYFSQRST
jgi:probable rRNA maturation factor